MTLHQHFRIIIPFVTILAALGCGDPSLTDFTDLSEGEAPEAPQEEASVSLEDELRFACESLCEFVEACPGDLARTRCADDCVDAYGLADGQSEECLTGRIDLLNCFSGLTCEALGLHAHVDCADAARSVRRDCGDDGLAVRVVDADSERIAEIDDREVVYTGDE